VKIFLRENVFDAALKRIRYLFDEFENVIVSVSGGKDSTAVLNLALMVAEEKNRLPQKVLFIDQEAEWETTISHIREILSDPRIEPLWFQMPIKIFNATSTIEPWLYCWQENKTWLREKEPDSIKINRYGTFRFKKLFDNILRADYADTPTCNIGGVRVEESPMRLVGLTGALTYKSITYGKVVSKKLSHYIFYPIYDWSYTDVWKAIHDNGWSYCKIYDYMYQYGVPIQNMRVSNLHHETALHQLFFMQEIEPDTWEKLTLRIGGINTAGVFGKNNFFSPKVLPCMFSSWREYRDYLLLHLIENGDTRERFKKKFWSMEKVYVDMRDIDLLYRAHINTILANDYHFTKLTAFECDKRAVTYRKFKKTGRIKDGHTGFIRKNEIENYETRNSN
jgi:predicted phosphoadenosine phosphosulfate sulfurtransferase